MPQRNQQDKETGRMMMELRKLHRETQAEVAYLLGLTDRSEVCRFESGQRCPSSLDVKILGKHWNVSPIVVLGVQPDANWAIVRLCRRVSQELENKSAKDNRVASELAARADLLERHLDKEKRRLTVTDNEFLQDVREANLDGPRGSGKTKKRAAGDLPARRDKKRPTSR